MGAGAAREWGTDHGFHGAADCWKPWSVPYFPPIFPIFVLAIFFLQLERAAAGQKGIHVKALQVGTGRWL